MIATVIDGKAIADEIRVGLKQKAAALKERGIVPGLAVLLIGSDPASATYVSNKEKGCNEVGIYSRVYRMPDDTREDEVLSLIANLNADEKIHGILVQLPLPSHLDEPRILSAVDAKKDVDGIHVLSAGSLMTGRPGFTPCTPKGIIELIGRTGISIEGKRAVVIGRSNIVGKPMAMMLLKNNATVTICHSRTVGLKEIAAEADILVAAVGKAEFVTGDMVKPGAIVIDVGSSKVNGKLYGDVNFAEAAERAAFITPVPGGVGPMTITMLLSNTIEGAELYG